MASEISIELKLQTENLKRQAGQAASSIKKEFSKQQAGIDPSSVQITDYAKADRIKAHKEMVARITRNRMLDEKDAAKERKEQEKLLRIKKPVMAPQISGMQSVRNAILPIGQVLASFSLITRAISVALTPIYAFSRALTESARNARDLFAKATLSGFGIQGSSMRGSIASIIGVSEKDIYSFGKQIEFLGNKLRASSNVAKITNPDLTEFSYNLSILKINFKAATDSLLQGFIPAILKVVKATSDELADFASKTAERTLKQKAALKFTEENKGVSITREYDYEAMRKADKEYEKKTGRPNAPNNEIFKYDVSLNGKKSEEYQKKFEKFASKFQDGKFTPEPYMKQMTGVSAWEKMGLQVGAGGGTNYNMQTATNTKKSNVFLERLLRAVESNKMSVTKPQGMTAKP